MTTARKTVSEKPEDLRFQQSEWLVQRLGWIALVLFFLAGCVGAFANDALSPERFHDALRRAATVYFAVLLFFRIAGKRSMNQVNTFDFVLLLIISEAAQPGLVGEDHSVVLSLLTISALIGLNNICAAVKQRYPQFERILEGIPLVIVKNGKMIPLHTDRERIDETDVLTAARSSHGIDRMEDIQTAVLERNGSISVIPRPGSAPA